MSLEEELWNSTFVKTSSSEREKRKLNRRKAVAKNRLRSKSASSSSSSSSTGSETSKSSMSSYSGSSSSDSDYTRQAKAYLADKAAKKALAESEEADHHQSGDSVSSTRAQGARRTTSMSPVGRKAFKTNRTGLRQRKKPEKSKKAKRDDDKGAKATTASPAKNLPPLPAFNPHFGTAHMTVILASGMIHGLFLLYWWANEEPTLQRRDWIALGVLVAGAVWRRLSMEELGPDYPYPSTPPPYGAAVLGIPALAPAPGEYIPGRLITGGPYEYTIHPGSLGELLILMGTCLWMARVAPLPLTALYALIHTTNILWRLFVEESINSARWGADWDHYRSSRTRFIPRLL